ncbi:hypothetical protein H0H93_004844 [Arthromyces matolae]|nr:hypothetical protein H0H93_004844 [Arthromyces matolae]
MSPRLPHFLRIPELAHLVFENVPDGRSLAVVAITCRYFAAIALPVLWGTRQIYLETLYNLIPERARLVFPDISNTDWARFTHYSQHVTRLCISMRTLHPCSSHCLANADICLHLSYLTRLLSGPSKRMDVTFKRVRTIDYYPSHYTSQGELCSLFPPLDPTLLSLFAQLPELRFLQLGSSSPPPKIDLVNFSSDVLRSLVLHYQDCELAKVLDGFHLPGVRKIQFYQFRPWHKTLDILHKLTLRCPVLEDISVISSGLTWFSLGNFPDLDFLNVFAALVGFNLVHLRFEMQARIILPCSLHSWKKITDHMTNLRTLVLKTTDDSSYNEATSIDLDVIVFLMSSLPVLEILLVPIIVKNVPLLRVSKETYKHPLHTLGTVFGDPPLAWAQSIVVCLKSIQDFAPEIFEVEDGEVRSPSDTWSLVHSLFSDLYARPKDDSRAEVAICD